LTTPREGEIQAAGKTLHLLRPGETRDF